jgi:hypothetical protein
MVLMTDRALGQFPLDRFKPELQTILFKGYYYHRTFILHEKILRFIFSDPIPSDLADFFAKELVSRRRTDSFMYGELDALSSFIAKDKTLQSAIEKELYSRFNNEDSKSKERYQYYPDIYHSIWQYSEVMSQFVSDSNKDVMEDIRYLDYYRRLIAYRSKYRPPSTADLNELLQEIEAREFKRPENKQRAREILNGAELKSHS